MRTLLFSGDTWHADLSPVAPTHMRVVPDWETLQA